MIHEVVISKEAWDTMTPDQVIAIGRLLENEHRVHVTKASPFDLPERWLSFRTDHIPSKAAIYGGIAPDGQVST